MAEWALMPNIHGKYSSLSCKKLDSFSLKYRRKEKISKRQQFEMFSSMALNIGLFKILKKFSHYLNLKTKRADAAVGAHLWEHIIMDDKLTDG